MFKLWGSQAAKAMSCHRSTWNPPSHETRQVAMTSDDLGDGQAGLAQNLEDAALSSDRPAGLVRPRELGNELATSDHDAPSAVARVSIGVRLSPVDHRRVDAGQQLSEHVGDGRRSRRRQRYRPLRSAASIVSLHARIVADVRPGAGERPSTLGSEEVSAEQAFPRVVGRQESGQLRSSAGIKLRDEYLGIEAGRGVGVKGLSGPDAGSIGAGGAQGTTAEVAVPAYEVFPVRWAR